MPFRIVLIHATAVSMPPIQSAFDTLWPAADCVNLLDDALSRDLKAAGRQTPEIIARMAALAHYGLRIGAAGILFSCSAFGRAIDTLKAELDIPVLKPNEAMFADALAAGAQIGMLTTFAPSAPSMQAEFYDLAKEYGKTVKLQTFLVEDAMSALSGGDVQAHNRLCAQAAAQLSGCDAIMLGQFSTSLALEAVRQVVSCPVLTSPASAVLKLKSMLA
jgi:Asp/Glu/hydantoin racemase